MEWEVVLRGPDSILEELAHAFHENEITIVRSKDGFVLRSTRFVDLTNAADVRLEATPLVEALSGISRMLLQSEASLGGTRPRESPFRTNTRSHRAEGWLQPLSRRASPPCQKEIGLPVGRRPIPTWSQMLWI